MKPWHWQLPLTVALLVAGLWWVRGTPGIERSVQPIAFVLVAALFVIGRLRPTTVSVQAVDARGDCIDDPSPAPVLRRERVPRGLSHVDAYVDRLARATTDAGFAASRFPGGGSLLLIQESGAFRLSFLVNGRRVTERERAIRRFFDERGIACASDHLTFNGSVTDAHRCLEYPAAGDSQAVAALCREALTVLYRIRPADTLVFQVNDAAAPL